MAAMLVLVLLSVVMSAVHAEKCNKPEVTGAKVTPDTPTIDSGSTYTVTCRDGFTLYGDILGYKSTTVDCQQDGKLSEIPTCRFKRMRLFGEIKPNKVEQSKTYDEGIAYPAKWLADQDWSTVAKATANDDGLVWFKLTFDKVHCIHGVTWWIDASTSQAKTCSATDCSKCEGDGCATPTEVSVFIEGEAPENLPALPDCKHGNVVKVQYLIPSSFTGDRNSIVMSAVEIAVTENEKDWIPLDEVVPGTDRSIIEHDLESVALQFKSDSEAGSEDELKLKFLDEGGVDAGEFEIKFSDKIAYRVSYCMRNYAPFPEDLPSDLVKIWTISLSPDHTKPRLILECNGVQVLDFLLSEDACKDFEDHWDQQWTKDVGQIRLYSKNGAFEGHRPAPECTKPEVSGGTITPDRPTIYHGSAYEVTCNEGFTMSGTATVDCQLDGELSELPTCEEDETDENGDGDERSYSHAFRLKISAFILATLLTTLFVVM